MSAPGEALRYAVRWPVLSKFTGQLALVVAGLTAVPALVSLAVREWSVAAAYLTAAGVLAGFGAAAARRPWRGRLQTSEAVVLAAAGFLMAPASAVGPFVLAGMTPLDAVFEAVSGITTTGLTMLADPGRVPPSLVFGRAWLQWCGGLGIVVFSLVLILPSGTVARDLGGTEEIHDDLLGGVQAFARRALAVYAALTLAAVLLLGVFGLGPAGAVLYALAAVSTGGFAPHAAGAAALSQPAQGALLLVCLAGALPMPLYIGLWRRTGPLRPHVLQGLALLAAGGAAGALLLLDQALGEAGPDSGAWHPLWLAFSAQTTAGFATRPPAGLPPASAIALMAAMSVGGGLGSTAGGVKLLRAQALLRLTWLTVQRTRLAHHAVLPVRFAGQALDAAAVQKVLLIPLLFLATVVASWLPFALLGYPPLDALFDVVSATGTVGLSRGVCGATLPAPLKLVLCGDMLLGRLEFVAWLVVLSPKTWIGRRL